MELHIEDLHAGYGHSQILRGVSLQVAAGEIVTVLGRNGAGRSTLAKAVVGLVACSGSITWNRQQLVGRAPHDIAGLGVGYVPEGREVFPGLTVQQNLLLGQKRAVHRGAHGSKVQPRPWTLDAVLEMFAALRERQHTLAGVLSGGEQQMLALCRTLMGNPQLLVVDEPTEGLAPQAAAQVANLLCELRAQGLAVLLIEQKRTIAQSVSDRCVVLGQGRIVAQGTPEQVFAQADVVSEWLLV
jgi:branched-chain amino acid transport system ATP-binding protein